ncbi:MAG: response regulator [Bacteroidales bacterium]|nr:response regulator [Bacteroidales bacterium]
MRIFYAEDDQMMQKMVAYALIRMGHEVVTVDTGTEAIETLKTEPFDFIVLDVFLPHYSGLDIARFIREELKSEVPIIILSRSGEEHIIKQAFEIGVNDYLTKPIEPDFLLVKIKKFTGIASG